MQPDRISHPREILPLRLMLGAAADQIVAGPSGGQRPELVFDALQYLPLLGRELSGTGLLDAQEQSLVHRRITAESDAGTSSDGIQGIVSRAFRELRNKTTPPESDPQAAEIRAQIRAYLDREGVESLDQALQHTVVEKTLQKEMGAFRSVVAGLAEGSPGRAKLLETCRARLLAEIPQDLLARYLALRRFDSIDDLLAAHARQAEFDREPVSMLRQNDALAFVAGPSTSTDLFDPNVDWIGEIAQPAASTSTPQGLISTIDAFLESDRALRLAGSPEELALWKSWWNPSNQGPNLSLRTVLIDRMALHDWDKTMPPA